MRTSFFVSYFSQASPAKSQIRITESRLQWRIVIQFEKEVASEYSSILGSYQNNSKFLWLEEVGPASGGSLPS